MKKSFAFVVCSLFSLLLCAQPCSDIFFSEYVEPNGGNTKVLEIYNPTSTAINLSNYQIVRRSNGCVSNPAFVALTGTLNANAAFVVANPSADAGVLAIADQTWSGLNFNGNDKLQMVNGTDTIDVIGNCTDPGSTGWAVGSGFTTNQTLVRNQAIQEGQTDWLIGASEWDVYSANDFTHLGSHTMISCGGFIPAQVDLITSNMIVLEDTLTVIFEVSVNNPDTVAATCWVHVDTLASTATAGIDFFFTPVQLSTPAGQTIAHQVFVTIVEDSDTENNEKVEIMLSALSSNAVFVDSTLTITIVDNDQIQVPCVDLFFSEYIETSSGNDKMFEIFNPTDTSVDMNGYYVLRFTNGSTIPGDTLWLADTLGALSVWYAANPGGTQTALIANANDTSSITFYNGNDALGLYNSTGTLIDVIGEIGVDPGTGGWSVGSGSTAHYTLVRKPFINSGQPIWLIGSGEWLILPDMTFDSIGSHTMLSCDSVQRPLVSFATSVASEIESAGSADISVIINNPDTTATSVEVVLDTAAGTATFGTDYTFVETTVTFPAGQGTPQTISITLLDDAIIESNETVVLQLQNATNNAIIQSSTFTLTINDDDLPTPEYAIATVNTTANANCDADSNGVRCIVSGTIHGHNLRGGGMQVPIIDNTGGITVFSFSGDFGLAMNIGDSLGVEGEITQFSGVTEIEPDTAWLISSGNDLVTPTVVTVLGESTESEYITFESAWIVDSTAWNNSGSGFNVDFTNGTETIVVRVDDDSPFFGQAAPSGTVHITGTGAQFDGTAPFCEGYQIFPTHFESVPDTVLPGISSNFADMNVRIYPNPSTETVWITANQRIALVKVTDLTGKVMMEHLTDDLGRVRLNLASFPAGIFLVHLETADGVTVRKVVKE